VLDAEEVEDEMEAGAPAYIEGDEDEETDDEQEMEEEQVRSCILA
jgi:hypothetical protein